MNYKILQYNRDHKIIIAFVIKHSRLFIVVLMVKGTVLRGGKVITAKIKKKRAYEEEGGARK